MKVAKVVWEFAKSGCLLEGAAYFGPKPQTNSFLKFYTMFLPASEDLLLAKWSKHGWLVVEPTHLKNTSQIGNLPQIGVEITNIWNYPLDGCLFLSKSNHWDGSWSWGWLWEKFFETSGFYATKTLQTNEKNPKHQGFGVCFKWFSCSFWGDFQVPC